MRTRILVVMLAWMLITTGTGNGRSLADIVQRGELRVAVQSGARLCLRGQDGEPAGSMVDFAKAWPIASASSSGFRILTGTGSIPPCFRAKPTCSPPT